MRPLIISERGQLEREARAHTPIAYQAEIDRLSDEFPYEALAAERARLVEEQRPHKEFVERQKGKRQAPSEGHKHLALLSDVCQALGIIAHPPKCQRFPIRQLLLEAPQLNSFVQSPVMNEQQTLTPSGFQGKR